MVISGLTTLKKVDNISTEYVENELTKQNINNLLRWAIVKIENDDLIVSYACEKD